MSASNCHHRRLAESELGRVEQCAHGAVHVQLGDVTLRLRSRDFQSIAKLISVAAHRARTPDLGETMTRTRLLS